MIGEIRDRMSFVKDSVSKLSMYRDILSNKLSVLEAEHNKSLYSSELYQKCSELFKKWLEESMEKNVNSISELATSGLKHVIHDQNISFNIKQESKLNRLSMKFVLEQDGVEGDPLTSFGGGPAVLTSLVLRLAVMTRMRMGNLLILDESMVSMANIYVPATAAFIRQLSEQTGINILMVTHNQDFIHHAHTAYEGVDDKNNERCLVLKKLNTVGVEV